MKISAEKMKEWVPVLDRLLADRDKIAIQELTIRGKKKRFENKDVTFDIGNMKCHLMTEGWKFQEF